MCFFGPVLEFFIFFHAIMNTVKWTILESYICRSAGGFPEKESPKADAVCEKLQMQIYFRKGIHCNVVVVLKSLFCLEKCVPCWGGRG